MTQLFEVQPRDSGTTVIAICFIGLAYILDPIVQTAYRRIRAYRAWREIQNGEVVEVTDYPVVAEVLWGRGKLDTGRAVAFVILLFSAASLALELKLDIHMIEDGPVDLYDRPPPVMQEDNGSEGSWVVLNSSKFVDIKGKGTRENFERGEDTEDNILEIGWAKSLYRLSHKNPPEVLHGVVVTSSWSRSVNNSGLHYGGGGEEETLRSFTCSDETDENSWPVDIYEDKKRWGNITSCEMGPAKASNPSERQPPTIILQNDTSKYLIVEENGGYPGFFYSVWKVVNWTDNDQEDSVKVHHQFHIESRFRLVEAIITGLVYGYETGGECVDLMMQFSHENTEYSDGTRAHPFGEHPEPSKVDHLIEVEPIPWGLEADAVGISSLVLLGMLSVVGIVSCLIVQSKIGMDIYDRDELIRAVTLPDESPEDEHPSAMRMFVRKDETDRIDVIISDVGKARDCFSGYFKQPNVVAYDQPVQPTVVVNNGDNIPTGPRTRRLESMRLRDGRNSFARGFGPQSLGSSPVQSSTCTPVVGNTPARDRALQTPQRQVDTREQVVACGQRALAGSSTSSSEITLPRERYSVYPMNQSSTVSNMENGEIVRRDTQSFGQRVFDNMSSGALAGGSITVRQRPANFFQGLRRLSSGARSRSNAGDSDDSDTTFSSDESENV